MRSWANYIARFRRTRGLTQREAAELLQVSQATLSRWEAGKQVPTPAERRRVQRRAEAVTGEARRLLVAVVRSSPHPVLLVDERLRVAAASGPLLRIIGLSEACNHGTVVRERLFGEDAPVLERLLASSEEEDELVAVDRVSEMVDATGCRLPLRQFMVRFVCGAGEVLYRVEVAPLEPAEYEARLTAGRRFVLLRRSDLLGCDGRAREEPLIGG